jgi:hypothetical protein
MLHRGVRTQPVIEDGHLVSVLSRHDLLRLFDRPDAEIRARVGELLGDPSWGPQGQVPGVIEVADRLTWREPDSEPA